MLSVCPVSPVIYVTVIFINDKLLSQCFSLFEFFTPATVFPLYVGLFVMNWFDKSWMDQDAGADLGVFEIISQHCKIGRFSAFFPFLQK